jgi:hypothetical protein
MKNDNGENGITKFPLIMNFFYTWRKLIYCIFVVQLWIIFIYPIIEFAYN